MRAFHTANDLDRSLDSRMESEEWADYVETCREQVRTAEKQLHRTASLIETDADIYAQAVKWLAVVEAARTRYDLTSRASGGPSQ